jgi:hypothetical protein
MSSFSVYPGAIDGYATLPIRIDGVHEIRADDVNRLRDAIIKIEQELGIEPSGVFATVAARLDSVADAEALITSHIADPIDAHDASAISILDAGDNYVSTEVEGALGELASILPTSLDVIGYDNPDIPNSGISSFVDGSGTLHVFNTSGGANELKKTQPFYVKGIHIIEIGENNGSGVGTLTLTNHSPATVTWTAPGDSAGAEVNISSLNEGEVVTLESSTTTKRIRITRSSESLPTTSPEFDTFDLMQFDAQSGTFSIEGVGFKNTENITRTAKNSTGTSRNQFTIGGMVFPADKGTLVLQRKLRLDADEFTPIAVLDLGVTNPGSPTPWAAFDEDLRTTQQLVYIPSLEDYDTITLFDRLPARKDYETLSPDADGNSVYENFSLEATFVPFQVAKYLIPVSNSDIVNGELQPPTDTTESEIEDKVSAYRIVHYKTGVTDFNGEPAESDIFSISDTLGGADDGDNTVRMANVFVDTNEDRPTILQLTLRPTVEVENNEKIISGIHYYNSENDKFDVALRSDTNVFSNTYLNEDILKFSTDVLYFPTGDGYGLNVDVTKLLDDGYGYFSNDHLPDWTTPGKNRVYYFLNESFLDAYRPSVESESYSNHANITATLYDPFGAGNSFKAYGLLDDTDIRLLINSFDDTRATDNQEWFTDESKRVGTSETFDFLLDEDQFTYEDGYGTYSILDDWDETAPLISGELQCGGLFTEINSPGLVYPQENYDTSTATIRPIQEPGTDYSGFSGDAIYQRLFSFGITTNGGRLRIRSSGSYPVSFDDIDANNSSRPIKIAVKIPGEGSNSTGFMDIGKLFETEEYDDDDGALAGTVTGTAGDFIVPFTFGTRNNADTGNMIAVRITYLNTALADAKTRIISYIELLEP